MSTAEIDPLALGVVFDFAPAVAQLDKFYANIQAQLQKSFDVKIAAPKMPTAKMGGGFDDNKIAGVGLALANVAERAEKAEISLERYAAAGSKTALAEVTFRAQSVEIQRLTQLTGNAELGARAMAAAQAQLAAATAPVVESYDGLGEALARVAAASEQAEAQLAQMAAGGSRTETLQLNFAKQAKEIERLGALSGNSAMQAKALSAAEVKLARDINAVNKANYAAAQSMSATAAAGGKLGVSTGAASAGMAQLGAQASDVVTQLQMGTNPMTILIQQGPQIAQAMQLGGIGVGFLAKALGIGALAAAGLTVSLTAMYGAFGPLVDIIGETAGAVTGLEFEPVTEAMEAQQRAAAILSQSYEDLGPILEDTRDKQLQISELTGKITEEQADLQSAVTEAFDRYQTSVEATRLKLSELKEEQSSVWTQMVDRAENAIPAWTPLGYAIRNLTSSTMDYNDEIYAGEVALLNQSEALAENVEVSKELITETKKHEEAEKGRKKAVDGAAKAAKEEADRLKALMEAREKLQEAEKAAANTGLTGAAEIAARRQDELEALKEIRDETLLLVKTEQERIALMADYTGASVAVDRKFNNERAKSYADAIGVITKQAEEARKAQLTGIEEVKAARQDEIAGIYKTQDAAVDLAETDEERLNAYKAADDARGEAEQRYMQQLKKLAEEQKQIYIDIGMTVLNTVGSMADMVTGRIMSAASSAAQEAAGQVAELTRMIDGLGTATVDAAALSGDALVDAYREGKVAAGDLSKSQKQYIANTLYAEKAAAEEREAAQRESAMTAFKIQKGIAIAIATINAIQAVSQAIGSAPPPANIPAIIAATAMGAASVAAAVAVPAPKFHSGTLYVDGPQARGLDASEVPAVLQRGEAVISRGAMAQPGARAAVNDIMQGRPGHKQSSAADVADGMDGSSVPGLLTDILKTLQRMPGCGVKTGESVNPLLKNLNLLLNGPAEKATRPGHRKRYA